MAPVWAFAHSLYNLFMVILFPNIRDKRAPANMTVIKNIHPNSLVLSNKKADLPWAL